MSDELTAEKKMELLEEAIAEGEKLLKEKSVPADAKKKLAVKVEELRTRLDAVAQSIGLPTRYERSEMEADRAQDEARREREAEAGGRHAPPEQPPETPKPKPSDAPLPPPNAPEKKEGGKSSWKMDWKD